MAVTATNPETGERVIWTGNEWKPYQEEDFQRWYGQVSRETGIDTNPDNPQHHYDYRSAYAAGKSSLDDPSGEGHWPSQFKKPDHPNRYVNGIDTITGRKARTATNPETGEKVYYHEGLKQWRSLVRDEKSQDEAAPAGFGRFAGKTGRSVLTGIGDTMAGAAATGKGLTAVSEKMGTEAFEYAKKAGLLPPDEVRRKHEYGETKPLEKLKAISKSPTFQMPEKYAKPSGGRIYRLLEDAVSGMASFAPGMALTAVNQPAGLVQMYYQILGNEFTSREDKLDDNRNLVASSLSALVQTPLEMAGTLIEINALGKILSGKASRYIYALFQTAVGEGLEEYLQSYPSLAADIYAANPDLNADELTAEFWKQVKSPKFQKQAGYQALAGAVGGGLMAGGGMALRAPADFLSYKTDKQKEIDASKKKDLLKPEQTSDESKPPPPEEHPLFAPHTPEEGAAMQAEIMRQRQGEQAPVDLIGQAQRQRQSEIDRIAKEEQAVEEQQRQEKMRSSGLMLPPEIPGREVDVERQQREVAQRVGLTLPPTMPALPLDRGFQLIGEPYTPEEGPKTPQGGLVVETEKPKIEAAKIDQQAQEAATSQENDLPEPTEAQIKAGNYKKGHIKVQGMDITIENPDGSIRSGTNPEGEPWSIKMVGHYGYFKRTEGKDGEQIDVFVGRNPKKSHRAYIIDQVDPKTGKFDEHKVVLGVESEDAARELYLANYEPGWKGLGAITEMGLRPFKKWLAKGRQSKPVGDISHAKAVRSNEGQVLPGETEPVAPSEPAGPTVEAAARPAVRQRAEQGGGNLQGENREKPEALSQSEPQEAKRDQHLIEDIKRTIKQAKADYDKVGIRTTDDPKQTLSPVYVDGEKTNEYLNGLSTTDINAKWIEKHITRSDLSGFYVGDYIQVVAGHDAMEGSDPGELIIRDPAVIKTWKLKKRLTKKASEATAEDLLAEWDRQVAEKKKRRPQKTQPPEFEPEPGKTEIKLEPEQVRYFINRMMEGKTPAKKRGKVQELVLTGGPPGAGKSTALNALIADKGNFIHADADKIKTLANMEDRADEFHEASSAVNKQLADKSINDGYDLIYDSLMTNYPLADSMIQRILKNNGTAEIAFTYIDADTSIARSMARILKGESKRKIPIEASVKGYNRALPTFIELYKKYSDNPDVKFALVYNNRDFNMPQLVMTKDEHGLNVFDQNRLDNLFKLEYVKTEVNGAIRYERSEKLTSEDIKSRLGAIEQRAKQLANLTQKQLAAPKEAQRYESGNLRGPRKRDVKAPLVEPAQKIKGKTAAKLPPKLSKLSQELNKKGSGRINGVDYKVLQVENGSYYYTRTKNGIRIEKGPGYPATWSRETAIEKALVEARGDLTVQDFGPTAKDKAKEAAQHLKNAADKFKAINDILGEKGEIGPEVDPKKWELIQPLLKEAWDEVVAAGKSMQEFVSLALENLSEKGRPYFEKFVKEDLTKLKKGGTLKAKETPATEGGQNVQDQGHAPDRNAAAKDLEAVRKGQKEAVRRGQRRAAEGAEVPRGTEKEGQPAAGRGKRAGVRVRGPAGRAAGEEAAQGRAGKRDHGLGERPARSEDRNHVIEPGDSIVPRGVESKIRANISAIQLLKKLESENRNPTTAEKKILAQYTGWGAFSQKVFDRTFTDYVDAKNSGVSYAQKPEGYFPSSDKVAKYKAWEKKYGKKLYPGLGGLMTEEEWKRAEISTINAHYTSRNVIKSMWDMATRLGFKGGTVLEPAAGVGHFFGLMPQELADKTALFAVELDTLSGGILKKLYPEANVQVTGFQNAKGILDNSIDLTITNVPFESDIRISDKAHPDYNKWNLHNWFIARSITATKPGGLVVVITSSWTLDARTNGKVREYFAQHADLLGAIRLPNNAFKANAGTEVVTDILVFRKKDTATTNIGKSFRLATYIEDAHYKKAYKQYEAAKKALARIEKKPPAKTAPKYERDTYKKRRSEAKEDVKKALETIKKLHPVNEYYHEHPENVLGKHSMTGKMYARETYTVEPTGDLEPQLQEAINRLPENVAGEGTDLSQLEKVEIASLDDKEGTLIEKEGQIRLVENGRLVEPQYIGSNGKIIKITKRVQKKKVRAYFDIREKTKALLAAMRSEDATDEQIAALQGELNTAYDAFVKKHGTFNNNTGNSFLRKIDNDFPIVDALEIEREEDVNGTAVKKIEKAPLFTKRTVFPFREPDVAESLEDAVNISIIYRGGIDTAYISDLVGEQDIDVVKKRMVESGLGFINPATGIVEQRDLYLSGNVKKKLKIAQAAAENDKAYAANVEALKSVIPADIDIEFISFKLGSTWLPPGVVQDFLKDVLDVDARVEHVTTEMGDRWNISEANNIHNVKNRSSYGTDHFHGHDLVEMALNFKRAKVMVSETVDGKTRKYEDKEAGQEAQLKISEINDEFVRWAKTHSKWSKELAAIYNEEKNGTVLRKQSVPSIKHYPGASREITLYDFQKRAVSRALQESVLLAYGVGTGKTFTLITTAMEMRRIGTAKKPVIVVHNQTVDQYRNSFKTLYPGAKVLIPDNTQRDAKSRKKLLVSMATNDWDAIVLPQSFFDGIANGPARERAFVEEQLEQLEQTIAEAQDEGDNYWKVKDLVKTMERRREKLEALLDRRKDEALTFEEMGIDAILVDEVHLYKRSEFYTKLGQVKGVDQGYSQRSTSLLLKSEFVRSKTGGKNIVTATGTPISNTLAELWTMLRYVRPDLLEQYDVSLFDQFASTFGEITIDTEETASGYKEVERFAKYTNGPELLTMFFSGADVQLTQQSKLKLPKMRGGAPQAVVNEKSAELDTFIKGIINQWRAYENLTGKEKMKNRHVPLVLYGQARKAAVDLRLIDPKYYKDDPNSKINKAVANIYEVWERTADKRSTQIVFCDLIRDRVKNSQINLHRDMRAKLVKLGVPEDEIILFSEEGTTEKKQTEMKARIRSGEARIIIGTTAKLGVGVDIADKLIAAHHVTVPDRPMDIEQRDGRIIRQGNENEVVEIYHYATRDTLDSVMFNRLMRKQKGADQILKGDIEGRDFDDPFSVEQATFSEFAAAASGKAGKLLFEKTELMNKAHKYRIAEQAHIRKVSSARRELEEAPDAIRFKEKQLKYATKLKAALEKTFPDGRIDQLTYEGETLPRKEIYEKIADRVQKMIAGWEKEYIGKPMGDFAKKAPQTKWGPTVSDSIEVRLGDITAEITYQLETNYSPSEKPSTPLRFDERDHWNEATGKTEKVVIKQSSFNVTIKYDGQAVGKVEIGRNELAAGFTRKLNAFIAAGLKEPDVIQEAINQKKEDVKEFEKLSKSKFEYAQELKGANRRIQEINKELMALDSEGEESAAESELPPTVTQLIAKEVEPASTEAESVEPPKRKAPPKTKPYYIHTHDNGYVLVENAKPVEIMTRYDEPAGEFFAHKHENGWTVSEATTGLAVGHGKTRGAAIDDAMFKVDTFGLEKLKEGIEAHVKEYGASPYSSEAEVDLQYEHRRPKPKGIKAIEIETAFEPAMKEWVRGPKLIVVQSQDQLPQAALNSALSKSKRAVIRGAFLNGKVYLVADNFDSVTDAAKTLFHESFGHYGLKSMLGRPLLKIYKDIYAAHKADVEQIAKQYKFDLSKPDQRNRAVEEWLSRRAAEVPKDRFVDRVVALIRRFFRKLGLDIKFSDAEIRQLLVKVREQVVRGKRKMKVFGPVAEAQTEFQLRHEKIRAQQIKAYQEFLSDNPTATDSEIAADTGLTPYQVEQIRELLKENKALPSQQVELDMAGRNERPTFAESTQSAPNPLGVSEYEKAKDEWFGEKDWQEQKNSVEASKFQDRIKGALGKKRYDAEAKKYDEAIQIYIDLKRDPAAAEKYRDDLNPDQKEILDIAEKIRKNAELPVDEQDARLGKIAKIADDISRQYDETGLRSLSEGVIFNVLDNYVNRTWKRQKGSAADTGPLFKTTSRHARQRVFTTILEGWALGYENQVKGATNSLELLKNEIARVIEDKRLIKTLQNIQYDPENEESPNVIETYQPDGYSEIKHPNFVVYKPVATVKGGVTKEYRGQKFRLQQRYAVVKEGNQRATKVFDTEAEAQTFIKAASTTGDRYHLEERNTIWERQRTYAPDEIAKDLNNILMPSVLSGPVAKVITKYNAILKSVILMTSLFHHQAFIRSYWFGTRHKQAGELGIRSAKKAGLDAIRNLDPIIEIGVRNGLTLGRVQDWAEELFDASDSIFEKMLDKTRASKAVKDKIRDLRQRQTDYLFRNLGAGLKAKAFIIEFRNFVKENPGIEINEAAKSVAKLINDDFGGLHLGRMGRNKTRQHIFRLLALAPDWTESNIRTMVKVFTKGGGRAERRLYQRFWASVLVKAGLMTILSNLLLSFGDDKDFWERYKEAWRAGNLKWLAVDITPIYRMLGAKDLSRKYFSILGHFRDVFKAIFTPIRFLHHKGSVLYRVFHEAMAGRDWKGDRFTTISELLGADEKGLYLTKSKTHKFGEERGGKLRGHLTTYEYGKKSGPISLSQVLSYTLAQARGSLPVQAQALLALMSGEIDAFDAISHGAGMITQSTRYTPRANEKRWVEYVKQHQGDKGKIAALRAEIKRFNEYQRSKGGETISLRKIAVRANKELLAEKLNKMRRQKASEK